MTVYDLIQVLAQYPPDADVKFDVLAESQTHDCGSIEITVPGRQIDMVFCKAAHGDSDSVIIRLLEV